MDLAAVSREATIGSAVALSDDKKQIFLIGGKTVIADSKFGTCVDRLLANNHSYDIQQNTWSQCSDLPKPLMYSAAASLNGHVYVTGGYTEHKTTNNVYAYDIKAKLC